MSESVSEEVKQIQVTGAAARVLTALAVISVLAFAWFGVRWQLGNMLGEVTQPSAPDAEEMAQSAKSLSPYDPAANWLLATVRYDPADDASIAAYADALKVVAGLSPHDYRWWVELGRAYEQSGQPDLAREAFLRSVSLNPNYAYPSWQYGNFELRRGDSGKAVEALAGSARLSSIYREQVFPMLWEYFDNDAARLDSVAGDDSEMLAGLSKFYASRRRGDDAVRTWAKLSPEDRQRNRALGTLVAQGLFEKHAYRASLDFLRSLGEEPEAGMGQIANGGFERALSDEGLFSWRQRRLDRCEVRSDSVVKRSGNTSLRMNFRGFNGAELVNLWQVFPVEAGRSYRLRVSVRTDDMKSAGLPTIEVAGPSGFKAADGSPVGTLVKAEVPMGTSDWQEVTLEFTAPQGLDGLQVRINRSYCGEACPISGTVWFDDFVLEVVQ